MTDPDVPSEPGSEPSTPEPSNEELERRGDPHVGTAYAVSVRSDADPHSAARHTVLTFRVHRFTREGSLMPPVAVELRGPVLSGMVADGDVVRLPDPAPHGGALRLTRVDNLTTRSQVVARVPRAGSRALLLIVFGLLAVVLVVVTVLFATGG